MGIEKQHFRIMPTRAAPAPTLLATNPFSALTPGFWLSLMLTGTIVAFVSRPTSSRLSSWLALHVLITVVSSVLTLLFFSQITWAGFFANIFLEARDIVSHYEATSAHNALERLIYLIFAVKTFLAQVYVLDLANFGDHTIKVVIRGLLHWALFFPQNEG